MPTGFALIPVSLGLALALAGYARGARPHADARLLGLGVVAGDEASLPSHHGHVTVLGEPPRLETIWPVPRQGRQAWGSED